MAEPLQQDAVRGKEEPNGRIVQEVLIPARGHGAFELRPGQVIRIVDAEGEQVPDVILFSRRNPKDRSSTGYTKNLNKTWKVTASHTVYSNHCNVMARIVRDTVGRHDWDGSFCSEEINHAKYSHVHGTANCRDNLAAAIAPYGLTVDDVAECSCINFFMNVIYNPDGSWDIGRPFSRAGDFVELLAEMDLLVAISACPQEHNPCNGFNPTSVGVVIYEPVGRENS